MLTWAETALPQLHYPLPGRPRVAVLAARLRSGGGVRCFPQWTCHQLMRAAPETIAAPLKDLLEVARLRDEGFLPGLNLELPLIVLSSLRSGPMTPEERSRLWNAFGLPFYEQLRDDEGRLLAYECDARAGFHWVGEESLERAPRPQRCACGLPAPAKRPVSVQTGSAARAMTGR